MSPFLILLFITTVFGANRTSTDPSSTRFTSCSVAECVNSGNVNLSTAIICNGCTARIFSNNDKAIKFYEFQEKLLNDDDDNFGGKKLVDLNVDVLSLIFDELDILDILNLVKAFPGKALPPVANTTFWRRYRD